MLHGLPKSARIGKDVYVNIRMLGAVTKWGINRNHLQWERGLSSVVGLFILLGNISYPFIQSQRQATQLGYLSSLLLMITLFLELFLRYRDYFLQLRHQPECVVSGYFIPLWHPALGASFRNEILFQSLRFCAGIVIIKYFIFVSDTGSRKRKHLLCNFLLS